MIFGGVFSELRDARRAQGKRYALEPLLLLRREQFESPGMSLSRDRRGGIAEHRLEHRETR
jgi:hypothetical protein